MGDDIIELRARRKSQLREAFRAIQNDPEHGPGTVVAFANWNEAHPHVDATLRGLLETGSITEPVRDDRGRGYAVVRILDEDEDPIDLGNQAPVSDPNSGTVFTESHSEPLDPSADLTSPEERPVPPPQSGPGSAVGNWREYAADATQTAPNFWADKSRTEIIEALESQNIPV